MPCTYTIGSRLVGVTTGPVDAIRTCNLGGGYRIATAVRHKSTRKLEVIAWDVQAGATDPGDARLAAGVSDYDVGPFAIAPVPNGTAEKSYVMTAAQRSGARGLHVSLWKIRPASVTRVDDVRSDPVVAIDDVAMAALDGRRFVTAAIGTGGKLHLHGWILAGPFFESIEQFAHHQGHTATRPAVTIVGGRPVVAKRNEAGVCEVVTFDVDGATFRVVDTARTSGTCSQVAIARTLDGVAVAMVDDEGRVQVHKWRVDADGMLEWMGHRQGSKASRVSILHLGDDSCAGRVFAPEQVVALSVGGGSVRALAVSTNDNPLPLLVDMLVTEEATGVSAAQLPGTEHTNDGGSVSSVAEFLVPFIHAGDDRMRLLFLSQARRA